MATETILAAILLVGALLYLARAKSPRSVPIGSSELPDIETAGRDAESLFRSLQGPAPPAPGVIFAVCELDHFETLRRHIGCGAANTTIRRFADAIQMALPGVEIGRLSRTAIEFAWEAPADGVPAATLAGALARLPRSYPLDGCALELRPRLGFVSCDTGLPSDETFELIEAALADPRSQHLDLIAVAPSRGSDEERLNLLRELSTAIADGLLEVHYQPKLDCRTETVASVEALLRWTHADLGAIRPDRVIAIAEETGLIRRLTDAVLNRVIADLRVLDAAGVAVPVYVNISGALLRDESFAAALLESARGLEHLVGLEITETAVIDDPERALANLAAFRAAGVSIAIDDYGSGLSSLAYLKQLPAQELKIDRLFISGLTSTQRDPLLVRSSIDLAHALEMKVTAEGVDNPMTLSLLTIMGCDMAQGYLIAPALPLDALIEFLGRDSHVAHIAPSVPAALFARG